MISNTAQTIRISSGSALPTCGHAFPASAHGTTASFAGLGTPRSMGAAVWTVVSTVVRERQDVVIDRLGFAKAYIPGTSAWRPPTC